MEYLIRIRMCDGYATHRDWTTCCVYSEMKEFISTFKDSMKNYSYSESIVDGEIETIHLSNEKVKIEVSKLDQLIDVYMDLLQLNPKF